MSAEYEKDGSLILSRPAGLPELLDVLIVGGGPAGTAAAFRAKEHGLHALVIDFDDLMKRIRDYPKDKLILPDFGGGDKMKFPAGDDLIAKLHFSAIDKDDICNAWKGFYHEFDVPARIGVELTGLASSDDGTWVASTWNHRTLQVESYHARYVVLALGRGVPRRFDIPGNTDGIAYRMSDPDRYAVGPVCVIGGGTSAAEAVVAISAAKTRAKDECPVVWSYRGSKMPRVSKALADVFFEAYVDNGNVRYYPNSEPVAVVTGPDRSEYLSLLVDRKSVSDRPRECVHLEFPKERCIACIGEDIPEALLKEFGISMFGAGEGDKKKMMAVSPLLETQQPGVFIIGDLLSQAYLETESFAADPGTFQRVKHRGNIKSSLRDGVFVSDVIQQKLEGRHKIEVVIRDAEPAQGEGTPSIRAVTQQVVAAAPVMSPDEGATPAGEETGYLVRMTAAGVDEDEIPLDSDGVTTIGRVGCDVTFPEDALLSDRHASITRREDRYYVRDDASRTGTFLRLKHGRPRALSPGDLIRLGRQILVLDASNGAVSIQHYDPTGLMVAEHPVPEGTTVLGRSGGKSDPDVVLAGEDMTLSRFHMEIERKGAEVLAEDFNSRNGTYLRVTDAAEVEHGDVIRVGGQTLRLNLRQDAPIKQGSEPTAVVAAPPSRAAAPPPAPAAVRVEASVTFDGLGVTLPINGSQTILEVADEGDVDLDYECWIGKCGCDLIQVLEGRENLSEVSEQEEKTIKRKGAEPGEFRLACMTRVSGPVVVRAVD